MRRDPRCDQPALRLVSVIAEPSWDTLLNHLHEDCPACYAETDLGNRQLFLYPRVRWFTSLSLRKSRPFRAGEGFEC